MNINRKMRGRIAQGTAIALTAVMMVGHAASLQAATADEQVATSLTMVSSDTTAGSTAALASMYPDNINVSLKLQGDAVMTGIEEGIEKAAQQKAADDAAAQAAAEAQAKAEAEALAAKEAQTTGSFGNVVAVTVTDAAQTTTTNQPLAATADETTLLAALIQCEAGNEPYEGQVAVGAVVVNRLNRGYANSISGVIFQKNQFTPANSPRLNRVLAQGPSASCMAAAQEALAGSDPTGGLVSFRPTWTGYSGLVIGHHVFF